MRAGEGWRGERERMWKKERVGEGGRGEREREGVITVKGEGEE